MKVVNFSDDFWRLLCYSIFCFTEGKNYMAKLYFRYGAMGSSKTANALMVNYNYFERGAKPIMLKPALEDRDGEKIIKSRIGLSWECEFVEDFLANMEKDPKYVKQYDAVIIDEAQFLTEEQVDKFAKVVDEYHVPVICYGLRTDFQSHLFPGSKRLLEVADKVEEVKTVCFCGKKATHNARVKSGVIIRDGEQVMMGGNESYVALCRKHFLEGRLE